MFWVRALFTAKPLFEWKATEAVSLSIPFIGVENDRICLWFLLSSRCKVYLVNPFLKKIHMSGFPQAQNWVYYARAVYCLMKWHQVVFCLRRVSCGVASCCLLRCRTGWHHVMFSCLFLPCTLIFHQDSSVVRFWPIYPMVHGSNPPSAKLSLRVKRVASSL